MLVLKKFLLLFLTAASLPAFADVQHTRCIIAGDSIQTYVYAKNRPGDASKLTASLIPTMTNVSIANMSGGGQRMASGGAAGWGLAQNLQAIWYVTGSKEPDCMIIALGTNDWGSPEIGLQEYVDAYKKVIDYSKQKGVTVVCALPTWNKEEDVLKPHADGEWKIGQLRDKTKELCLSENLKVFDPTKIGLKSSDFPDGLHMGWHGHSVYVKALVAKMQEWKIWPKS